MTSDNTIDFYLNLGKRYENLLWHMNQLSTKLVHNISKTCLLFYKPLRIVTYPWGKIIPYIWYKIVTRERQDDELKKGGLHLVMGPMGCGKSSITFQTIEELYQTTGFGAYINANIETPKIDENGNKYRHHKPFSFTDIAGVKKVNGKLVGYQKQFFKTWLFPYRVYEEMHRVLNPRFNKEKNYNLLFKVILDDILINRHEGTRAIYMISQLITDIQFMSVTSYVHRPTMVRGINYRRWIKTGIFEIVPTHWIIDTYQFDPMKKGLKLLTTWKKKVDLDILETFDTHAEKSFRKGKKYLQ